MRQLGKRVFVCSSLGLVLICGSHAMTVSDGFYASFQGGMAFTPNRDYDLHADAWTGSSPVAAVNSTLPIKYPNHPSGYDLSAAFGYKISPIRFEAEFTYLSQKNEFNNYLTRDAQGAVTIPSSKPTEHGARVMGNVYFDFDMLNFIVTPYIGAGIGYSYTHTNVLAEGYLGYTYLESGSAHAFATQAIAGLKYAINENVSIDLVYHYHLTFKTSIDLPFQTVNNNLQTITVGQSVDVPAWSTNLVNLGISYHFG